MNLTELQEILGWRLGDRSDMGPRMLAELPILQETILEANPWLPWFLLSTWTGVSTSAGTAEVAVPTDFLLEAEESALYVQDSDGNWIELPKDASDVLAAKYLGSGFPRAYSLVGNSFRFFPVPDAPYPLKMVDYYARADAIATLSPVSPWLTEASDVVLGELGKVISEKHLKDGAMAATFAQDAARGWKRLYDKHIAREEVNFSRSLKGNS